MRKATSKNGREVTILEWEDCDGEIEHAPASPFGALVVIRKIPKEKGKVEALAKRLLETGCGWATLHGDGRVTDRLHKAFDKAIVDYDLKHGGAEMGTSGEVEDDLEEAMRDAVYDGRPHYGEAFGGLLVLIIGEPDTKLAERAESLAASVEDM